MPGGIDRKEGERMRDRLIDLLTNSGVTADTETFEEIADYLIKNGVIVPPCKVGDMVWYITGIHRNIIKSAIVNELIVNCNGVSDLFVSSDTADFENSVDIFYFTKEEAEKALKEREKV